MENTKYIVREYSPEACDLSFYFDDGLTEKGGEYCYNLFILYDRGWGRLSGFNIERYQKVQQKARYLIEDFELTAEYIENGDRDAFGRRATYKKVMEQYGIPYNSRKCHALKEWAKNADEDRPEDIAAFLTITTGKKWDVTGVYGYCQGDYVEIVYCPEHYKSGVQNYGEVWLGCAKEFCVIELGDDSDEIDRCGGYIVADSEAWDDEDYKRIVCEWACIPEDETQLEMFDGYTSSPKYRIA